MNEEYKYLDEYERKIIVLLYSVGQKLSTREIAKQLEIHWITAKKNLRGLHTKGVVKKISMGNKKLWELKKIKI